MTRLTIIPDVSFYGSSRFGAKYKALTCKNLQCVLN